MVPDRPGAQSRNSIISSSRRAICRKITPLSPATSSNISTIHGALRLSRRRLRDSTTNGSALPSVYEGRTDITSQEVTADSTVIGDATIIDLGENFQTARYIRIYLTEGSSAAAEDHYWWSIHYVEIINTRTLSDQVMQIPSCNPELSDSNAVVGRPTWATEASPQAGDAYRAKDNNPATRWTTKVAQAGGMYFQINFLTPRTFNRISLDTFYSLTPNTNKPGLGLVQHLDHPRIFEVQVSNDGTTWRSVQDYRRSGGHSLLQGTEGTRTDVCIAPQTAQYVRIRLDADSTLAAENHYWWSISEINVHYTTTSRSIRVLRSTARTRSRDRNSGPIDPTTPRPVIECPEGEIVRAIHGFSLTSDTNPDGELIGLRVWCGRWREAPEDVTSIIEHGVPLLLDRAFYTIGYCSAEDFTNGLFVNETTRSDGTTLVAEVFTACYAPDPRQHFPGYINTRCDDDKALTGIRAVFDEASRRYTSISTICADLSTVSRAQDEVATGNRCPTGQRMHGLYYYKLPDGRISHVFNICRPEDIAPVSGYTILDGFQATGPYLSTCDNGEYVVGISTSRLSTAPDSPISDVDVVCSSTLNQGEGTDEVCSSGQVLRGIDSVYQLGSGGPSTTA